MTRWNAALALALLGWGLPLAADDAERRPDERRPEELFRQLDADRDGVLTRSEVPEGQQRFFDRLIRVGDRNEDGKLTLEEFVAAMNQPQTRAAETPPGGGPGGRPGFGRGDFNPGEMFERLDRNGDGKLTRDELPEPLRERLGQMFERLGKDSLTREEFMRAQQQLTGGRPGAAPGEGRFGPEFLARLRAMDVNKDGKVTLDEAPEEARPRIKEMLERMGRDSIDLERMAAMMEGGGPDRRPGERPREGDRPAPEMREGGRPPMGREGERRPMGREGDRPAFNREGDRPPMGRDGDRPPMGRDGDRPAFNREGERPPMGRDGDRPPLGRDGDRPPLGRDGDRPPMGRDGERPPFGRESGERGAFVPRLFRELDRNRDGRLSRDELAGLMERFSELDANGDGFLDVVELVGPGPGGPGMREGDGGRPPFGPRDGEGPREGFRPPRDGEGQPREGFRPPRDGDGPPPGGFRGPREGDRPQREGETRPAPEGREGTSRQRPERDDS